MISVARQFLNIGLQGKLNIMEYYNNAVYPLIEKNRKYKIKPSDEWCACFVSVIAHKMGLKPDSFPYEVSVYYMTQKARKMGTFTRDLKDAQVNDLVIYDWKADGTLNHVGILQEIGSDYIKVLEGNYGGTVKVRTVKTPNSEVYGFIKTGLGLPPDIESMARDVIKGRYGYGLERQKALGRYYAQVQERVNQILG